MVMPSIEPTSEPRMAVAEFRDTEIQPSLDYDLSLKVKDESTPIPTPQLPDRLTNRGHRHHQPRDIKHAELERLGS
jgi:hypothetical protein